MHKPLDTLLAELRGLGIKLWVDPATPDKLKLRAAEGALTPALREALTQRKAELLGLLAPQVETPLLPLPPQESYELSPAQRRLWVLAQFPEGAAAYHIPLHQRLDGPLDRTALERAFNRLVARHESLRTTFAVIDGEPRQVVHAKLPLRLDYRRLEGNVQKVGEAVRALGREHVEQPFDLGTGPLLRACLLALAPERHVLLFTIHHIVADGMSLGVLARDLSALYQSELRGTPDGLPTLALGYPAYAAWQNARQQDAAMQAHQRWWHEVLAGEAPVLELPADRPRPPRPSYRGAELSFMLPREPLDALQAWCAAHQASLFMGLHALLKVLLARWSGQQDIVVGTVVAGREQPELLDQVGFYLNTLALRSAVRAETPFEDFLTEVAAQTRQAFDHQAYPFDRLVGELQVRRDPSRFPLFDVMLVLQSQDEPGLALGELRAQAAFEHPGSSKFDLTFCFKALPSGLVLAIEYATDLYDAARIRRLGGHFMQLVQSALAAPRTPLGRLELLTPAERRQLLDDFNGTATPFPHERTAVDLFEAMARAAGERTALVCGGRALSYVALDAGAERLARRLRRLGAGPGSLVGLHVARSPELVIGLLGILKAGAAYVPLDPSFPAERLSHIVDDAGVRLLVVHGNAPTLAAAGPLACVDVAAPDEDVSDGPAAARRAGPQDLAYVIYTSGSTGRPKGVEIPNRALVNCLTTMAQRPGLRAEDVLLSVTTVSFDIATLELLLPLVTGARLVLATDAETTHGLRLAALLHEHGTTVMQATPATWHMLIAAGWSGTPGLKILCGGEALPGRLGRELRARAASVWNMYGPTETTIWSTCHELGSEGADAARDDAAEPIGRPIANTTLYVLDALLQPVPVGVPGDLYIGGDGLAVGYRGKADLTAEKFIASPFATATGERLYRTGDSARWREDGLLEFLGRTDQQVKLRGFRIELGEIEAVLAEHPDVAQAVVDARANAGGDLRLVAWYLRRDGGTALIAVDALREHVKRRLPAYMVPAQFVALAALPMTPNAKVDRRALHAPAEAQAEAEHAPPRSSWECRLAGLWQEVLGVSRVGSQSDFFALGGHSLKAAALAARVQQDTGVALTLVDVFQAPTLAELAACCEARGTGAALPLGRTRGPSPAAGDALSPAQRRLWVVEQMADGSGAYNIPASVWLDGALDEAALEAALHALVARHESLRTTFRAVDGEPRQFVHEAWHLGEVLERIDCSAETEPEEAARRIAARHAARRFDLAQGPLLRTALVRVAPQRHLLLFNIHHIVSDLASMEVLVREISSGYEACSAGRAPAWAPLPLQYRDYAAWQQVRLSGPEGARHRDYWLQQLAPPLAPLELPADAPRPPLKTWGARVWRAGLGAVLAGRVRGCALRHAMTPFMVLTAALGVLLHRYTGSRDVIVGFPLAGRERAELAGQVGFFVNTVALRQQLQAEDHFDAVLERVRRTLLQAYEHQDYPFDRLVEELQLPRDLSRSPVFDVTVSLLHAEAGALRLGAARATPLDSGFAAAKTDLAFEFQETATGLELAITYATDLFGEARIRRMGTHFARLLGAATARPHTPIGQLPLLSPLEAWQLREGFNGTAQPFDLGGTVVELFRRQVDAAPDAPAVRFEGCDTSYADLARDVERIAALLAAHGVGRGTRVGVYMAPSAQLPAAFLGVLAAGGVYVPLDTANPPARLQAMVADAGVALVLTQAPLLGRLQGCAMLDCEAQPPVDALASVPARPGPQAYVIFTSGSTGRPKPTVLTHRGILNIAHEQARLFAPGRGDRVLQFAALGFDASVFELVLALCHGATLCLAPREALLPGPALRETLERERISMVLFPPSALAALPADAVLPSLRLLTVGGEACPAEVVRRWAPGRAFFNLYGPTEITIFATAARCEAGDGATPTIGGPIFNVRVHVLDAHLRPVPMGVPGELCIAGVGVGEGYLGLAELTAERFVADPFDHTPGARLYRSGDLARWRADGHIEYLGRIDQQLKLRGFRIEPGEIEAVLGAQPQVADAVVLLREDGPQNRYLVGFVTPRDTAAPPDARALRELVRERLPEYMVPARVVVVPRLPMTPNQKIDRRALLEADDGGAAAAAHFEAPRDDVEHVLAGFFAEVLKVEASRIGALDNFFELGGDSLLATRIVSRLQSTFRSGVTIPQLLRAGHVRALAEAVRASLPLGQADTVAAAWRRIQALTPAERLALIERTSGPKRPATHTTP